MAGYGSAATRPTDGRKAIDGPALLVPEYMGLGPVSGAAIVFRARRADRMKVPVRDRTGMILVHERLEGVRVVWPQVQDGVMHMSPARFAALFEGLDRRLARPGCVKRPEPAVAAAECPARSLAWRVFRPCA